jgi:hypothetical protein
MYYAEKHGQDCVVLLHTIQNSLIDHLVIDGHITVVSGKEILISPVIGIITTLLCVCVGLLLRHYRIRKFCPDLYLNR